MNDSKQELEKNVTIIEDYFEITSLIDSIFSSGLKIYLWQNKGRNDKRLFHYGKIHKVELMQKILRFVPVKTQGFKFEISLPLYFFSEDKCVAWKALIKKFEPEYVTCDYPQKISRVEKDFVEKLQFVEMEDEEKHVAERAAPRKTAKEGQRVAIERLKHEKKVYEFLYDLSQGGMAFVVDDPGEYEVGEKLRLCEIDGVNLENKPEGEVVAIRKKDDCLDEFKVCVKFVN